MTLLDTLIIILITNCAYTNHVDPYFAIAVAHVESRTNHKMFRIGCIGKTYAGPMGLHIAYVKDKFNKDATDLETNIQIGVRALRGRNELRILKRYNAQFSMAYYKAIMRAKRDFKKRLQ